nr:cyclic nucleotide-binding domain-containing protein [Tabrizicola sp.]
MPHPVTLGQALKSAIGHGNGLLEKLLESLPPDVTAKLLARATLREVEPGQTVVERGTRSEDIGYVLEGTLAMVQVFEDGKRHIVGFLV